MTVSCEGVSKQGLRRSMHSLSANLHGLTRLQRTHMGWSRSGCLNNHLLRPPVPVCGQAVAISHGARHLLCKVALPFIDSKINPDKLWGWRRLLLWDLLIKCTVPCYHAFSNSHSAGSFPAGEIYFCLYTNRLPSYMWPEQFSVSVLCPWSTRLSLRSWIGPPWFLFLSPHIAVLCKGWLTNFL